MRSLQARFRQCVVKALGFAWCFATFTATVLPQAAQALPLFARQTGQNCMACHAGGQFPELTPYGRMFKMTGFTLGQRTNVPISVMGLVSNTRVADTDKTDNPGADFQMNNQTIIASGSLFLGGKITNNVGAFIQITHNPFDSQADYGSWKGRTVADNMDIRYADRFIDEKRDLIFGFSFNNNPSVTDPWNTAAAWIQYVPVPGLSSSQFIDGNAPYPKYSSGGNVAGLNAYAYWNQSIYAELGGYSTSKGLTSVASAGLDASSITQLNGVNPYWRFALNKEWGAHSLMVGTAGMTAQVFDAADPSALHYYRDTSIDAQYQYLLDPHSVTAQLVFARNNHRYPDSLVNVPSAFSDANGNMTLANTSSEDTTDILRAKLTYVYQAKYGGSLGYFSKTGTVNTANQNSGYDPATMTITSDPSAEAPSSRVTGNLTGDPATKGWTIETFWLPTQYTRVGIQYTNYSVFNGASQNYDGFGRHASDNNSLIFYLWAAY